MKAALRVVSLLALSAIASSQATVWVVDDDAGPGVHFTNVKDALAGSGDGDVLLFKAGNYSGSFLPPTFWTETIAGRSLSLVAEDDAEVVFDFLTLDVRNLGADDVVLVRGIEFRTATLFALDNLGTLWVEDCEFPPFPTPKPGPIRTLQLTSSANVAFVGVDVQGTWTASGLSTLKGDALVVTDTTLAILDSSVSGGDGPLGRDGGNGITLDGGTAYLAGSTVRGGDGGELFQGNCGNGGHGILLEAGAPLLRTLDSALAGGDVDATCAGVAQPGSAVLLPSGAHQVLAGTARSLTADSPVRESQTLGVHVAGAAGDQVFALVTGSPGALYLDPFQGVLLVGTTSPLVLPLGALPGTGQVDLSVSLGPLPAGLQASELVLQLFAVSTALELRLGGASLLTILDASL
ncbi:MAG: hypothetical protein AAF682_23580 [Planctomycetota bacterium]